MKYYVYTLARPDGTIFYVGKGSGKRIEDHEKEARRGHMCRKCAVIRAIWQQGGTVQRAMVFETEDEWAALEYESELIRHYGLTQLVNRSFIGGQRSRVRLRQRVRTTPDAQPVDLFMATRTAAYQAFLIRLRAARKHAHLTQVTVALRLNKPQSYVSKCESGERRVDATEVVAFADLYRVSIDELVRDP